MAATQVELNVSDLKDIVQSLKQGFFPNDRWSPLGLQLGLLQPTLSAIRAKHRDDPESCLQDCLTRWLSKVDSVTKSGGPTWDSLASALEIIGEVSTGEKIKEFKVLSAPACQLLHKHSDRLLPLSLPVKILQMLYTERVISKETLDEVNRLGGVLGDGPLNALCTTLSDQPVKLKVFASVLLKSKQTAPIAKDMLTDYEKIFPSQFYLQPTFQYDFDQMRMNLGNLFYTVSPLINKGIPSLQELKTYLRMCFRELRPLLATAESFNDVMEIVLDKCTIINVCCLEGIVGRYDISEARAHIENYNTTVDIFCKKVKADVCCNQSFTISSCSHQLTCETIVFIVEWEADKHTLFEIKGLLSKAFEGMAKSVQVKAVNEGSSIIVTCYAPHSLIDLLLMTAKENLDLLKQLGVIKITIGYCVIYDEHQKDKEVRAIVEENTKELRSRLKLQETISRNMTMEIASIKQNEEMKQSKERVKELKLLLKLKEDTEKELLSVSIERHREIETLQKITTSLTLQSRDRSKQIEKLRQSLRDHKPVSNRRFKKKQTQKSKKHSMTPISKTTESQPISKVKHPFKGSADNSSLSHQNASNAIFKVEVAPEELLKESDSHPNPFDFLIDTSNAIAKVEEVPKEFLKLVRVVQDAKTLIDEAENKDEDVATAINQVHEAVDTAFVHARSYITKCYEVADYICDEVETVVKAIEEGNVKEFKDFLEEVLDKSRKCQKDITTLLHFIEEEKEKIIEEEKKAKTKKDEAAANDRNKSIAKGVAGGGLVAAGSGVIAAGALLFGPQAIVTVPALLGVGLFGAAAATIYSVMWGSSLYQFYGKAIKAFEDLRKALPKIENALKKVNEQLKLGIKNNLSEMKRKSGIKDFINRSIIKKLGTVKVQSEHLKEYCGPLKDAKDLEDFKKIYQTAK